MEVLRMGGQDSISRRRFLGYAGALGVGLSANSLLAACGTSSGPAAPLTPVTFLLDVAPYGKHALFYVPLQNGYWKEQGLDVSIHSAQGSLDCVNKVAQIVTSAAAKADDDFTNRKGIVQSADAAARNLVDEYFDVLPTEKVLVDDTIRVIVPSTRPSRNRQHVPTITPSKADQRNDYIRRLCDTLNGWAKGSAFVVQGSATASMNIGLGLVVLQKTRRGELTSMHLEDLGDLLVVLEHLRQVTSQKINMVEIIRGIKIFDGDRLYLMKPIGQRFWTQTAALNDADEIAGSILMHPPQSLA
jgi:hypothetical protein